MFTCVVLAFVPNPNSEPKPKPKPKPNFSFVFSSHLCLTLTLTLTLILPNPNPSPKPYLYHNPYLSPLSVTTWQVYQDYYHELLNEDDGDKVEKDIIEFINARA
jgi:hypothetical protein